MGWAVGIIVNNVCDVLPLKRRLEKPWCPYCRKPYIYQIYFLLKPCIHCGAPRTRRAELVQVLLVGLSIVTGFFPPMFLGYWAGLVILAYFGVVFVMDLEYRVILHPVSLTGVVIGLAAGLLTGRPIGASLIGGAAGFGIMYLLYGLGVIFLRMMRKDKHEDPDESALGFGDVNFSGVLGLFLGWPVITYGLLAAILMGGLVSGILILFRAANQSYKPLMAIPYAPFLVLSGFFFVFCFPYFK